MDCGCIISCRGVYHVFIIHISLFIFITGLTGSFEHFSFLLWGLLISSIFVSGVFVATRTKTRLVADVARF